MTFLTHARVPRCIFSRFLDGGVTQKRTVGGREVALACCGWSAGVTDSARSASWRPAIACDVAADHKLTFLAFFLLFLYIIFLFQPNLFATLCSQVSRSFVHCSCRLSPPILDLQPHLTVRTTNLPRWHPQPSQTTPPASQHPS